MDKFPACVPVPSITSMPWHGRQGLRHTRIVMLDYDRDCARMSRLVEQPFGTIRVASAWVQSAHVAIFCLYTSNQRGCSTRTVSLNTPRGRFFFTSTACGPVRTRLPMSSSRYSSENPGVLYLALHCPCNPFISPTALQPRCTASFESVTPSSTQEL